MAENLQQTVDRLSTKMELLLERYRRIEQLKVDAETKLGATEEELRRCKAQNQELRQKLEFLQIATTIAPDRATVTRSRALISEMVREIDKCLNELND